jgi:molecular chaperone GrpE
MNENQNQENQNQQNKLNGDGQNPPEEVTPSSDKKQERKPVAVTITDIELEQLKKDAAESKDKYLRVLADQENLRKRLIKEREQQIQFSTLNTLADFLTPIDHLENALKFASQTSDEVRLWAHGFEMILNQFKDVLAQNNVVPIVAMGKHIDPHYHEAIESVETDEYPPGTIIEECARGYKMGERTVRPSRVKVAVAPNQKNVEENK